MHSHIIFDVDDGPKSIEESIKMFDRAVVEGITEVICTSHAFHPQYHSSANIVKERTDVLRNALKMYNIPLTIHTGHEVRLNGLLCQQVDEGSALTLALSKFLLLELPSQGVPRYTFEMIDRLLAKGIIPVIAHPERNQGIAERPEILEKIIRQGAISQVNAGSIVGHFGKRIQHIALKLINAHLIHSYGSDVHNLTTRPFLFEKGLSYLEKQTCSEFVDILLENNTRIISNDEVIVFEPENIEKRKWWGLFTRK